MTSGELDFNNFSQRNSAPGAPMPAVSNTDQNQIRVISSLEEMRAAVEAVAASAQRLMSIYTPDLEPDLYDQNGFLDIMKRFVLARRFAKARVLLSDTTRLLRDNNRFIAMGRQAHELHRHPAGSRRRQAARLRLPDRRRPRHRVPRSFRSLGRRRRSQQSAGGPSVSRRVRRDLAGQLSRRTLPPVAALIS